MSYYLSKLLPLFVMPITIAIGLMFLSMIFMVRNQRKVALTNLVFSVLVLWIFAMPPVATALIWSLEKHNPPVAAEALPRADCIIVLGGALGYATFPRIDIELSDAVDRVYQAAKIYRLGKGRTVVVTAGNQPWARHLQSEANLIRELLVQWGVPENSILVETNSRNTYENAVYGAELIGRAGCESNLLVTSAWHMSRAKATFVRQGIPVTAVPVDIRSAPMSGGSITQLVPRADALAESSQAIMEWLGILVYRLRGWA